MSAGPIKAARDAWKPPVVSTTAKDRVCMKEPKSPKAYCGRGSAATHDDWQKVTCADCHAAHRADEAVV